MTDWQWWAGNGEEVDADGFYAFGDFDTREQAIAAGLRETRPGDVVHVIEARSSTDMRYEGSDFVPFLRTRNHEVIVNGPQA